MISSQISFPSILHQLMNMCYLLVIILAVSYVWHGLSLLTQDVFVVLKRNPKNSCIVNIKRDIFFTFIWIFQSAKLNAHMNDLLVVTGNRVLKIVCKIWQSVFSVFLFCYAQPSHYLVAGCGKLYLVLFLSPGWNTGVYSTGTCVRTSTRLTALSTAGIQVL